MQTDNPYAVNHPVAMLEADRRSAFIWRTYAHVVGAILAFAAISTWMFKSGVSIQLFNVMQGNWLLVLGAFMIASWGANYVAHRLESQAAQYAAFAVYVVAQAVIFAPLFVMAIIVGGANGPGIIESAATVTIVASVGLMAVAMLTGKDFSFLRGLLVWGGILALVGIVASLIFGFELGTWFSVAMIGFAGAAVLYDTSNIMHHYPENRHVAAAMSLFASIALMFWYVLRLFLSRE
ncbi:MAG: Bax inhibitor-1 family protein [Pseudomonadota bacterium]